MIKDKDNKILVGGQKLRNLGSDRHTEDIDYICYDNTTNEAFITSDKVDYLNAASDSYAGRFFNEVLGSIDNEATPQALLELKAFAFVQHCQNFNWQKVDASEYDIKFLVRNFNLTDVEIVKNYISEGEYTEVKKIINNVK